MKIFRNLTTTQYKHRFRWFCDRNFYYQKSNFVILFSNIEVHKNYEIKLQIPLRARRFRCRQTFLSVRYVRNERRTVRLSILYGIKSDAVSFSTSLYPVHHQPAADRFNAVPDLEVIKEEKQIKIIE